ncbi:MAG: metal-sulfur cluster assembly factor [Gemmatimonadetes bacterium]|nr:metal-sulfur cluster assembly factor [Gemmatimonadota bacterium]
MPGDPEAAVRAALEEVRDPEFPISVVDLGLVYGLRVLGRRVDIWLTFTATACPCTDLIEVDVRERLLREGWVEEVVVHQVWDPPWTKERISAAGRERLRRFGVSV